jgi:uncharacterized protein (DUF1501 family)
MLTRRTFLGSTVAAAAVLGGAVRGRAQSGAGVRRFLFLHAEGGWDPLCVFAPMFGSPRIEMEPQAEPWSVGGLSLVDHPDRPRTRSFFERRAGQLALLGGVSTRSVNHETCQIVALTGSTSEERPDVATILGYEERQWASLPHLVMSGPAFPGPYGVFVSQAEGQLQQTIDGTILVDNDAPLRVPASVSSRMVDRHLAGRADALLERHRDLEHAANYREAFARARDLVDSRLELRLLSSTAFVGRAETAIAALASGVSRCASVGTGFVWDTHNDNTEQSALFDGFFTDLERILVLLETTAGPEGRPLRDDTVVVVTSEMARTPAFNGTGGRDHWPYTSMLMLGPGVRQGSFGGYTDLYTGVGIDEGGGLDPSQPGISAEALCATLLVLGDVDPDEHLRGASPLRGVLA